MGYCSSAMMVGSSLARSVGSDRIKESNLDASFEVSCFSCFIVVGVVCRGL